MPSTARYLWTARPAPLNVAQQTHRHVRNARAARRCSSAPHRLVHRPRTVTNRRRWPVRYVPRSVRSTHRLSRPSSACGGRHRSAVPALLVPRWTSRARRCGPSSMPRITTPRLVACTFACNRSGTSTNTTSPSTGLRANSAAPTSPPAAEWESACKTGTAVCSAIPVIARRSRPGVASTRSCRRSLRSGQPYSSHE